MHEPDDHGRRTSCSQGAPGPGGKPENAGELNYANTRLVDAYLVGKEGLRYAHLNEVFGALECGKLELYRRIAAPYEDRKLRETGDVYRCAD